MENDYCLSNLLEELLVEYRIHHRNRIAEYQRLNFELNTLLESKDYSVVDVYCSPSQDSVSLTGCIS